MYLIGCRDVRSSQKFVYNGTNLEGGMDRLIEWLLNPKIKIFINSKRSKEDPLYLSPVSLNTSVVNYSKQLVYVIYRKGFEGVLRILMLRMAIICTRSQSVYTKNEGHPTAYISLVMLGVHTFAYSIPLITGNEVLDSATNILLLAALWLNLKLFQNVCESRGRQIGDCHIPKAKIPSDKIADSQKVKPEVKELATKSDLYERLFPSQSLCVPDSALDESGTGPRTRLDYPGTEVPATRSTGSFLASQDGFMELGCCQELTSQSQNKFGSGGRKTKDSDNNPSSAYTYHRFTEIENHCNLFLSLAFELKPDDSRGHRLKNAGGAPLMPFDDSDMPWDSSSLISPLKLLSPLGSTVVMDKTSTTKHPCQERKYSTIRLKDLDGIVLDMQDMARCAVNEVDHSKARCVPIRLGSTHTAKEKPNNKHGMTGFSFCNAILFMSARTSELLKNT
ncbi:hypothetical protein HYC85_026205 [Camellia sinensis]|uniref:RING-type E3 ubiquitin transferase n=1 Tax=Camellia sinensis TaxID=4442 RepID=A0A7J7G6Z2_CAMSI|nr:hypothetical protein HYC85_026205 [Camellia sinensis]